VTEGVLPPDARRLLEAHERRIAALERALAIADRDSRQEMVFSLSGALFPSTSPPWYPRRAGAIRWVVAALGLPGQTDTVIDVQRNGAQLVRITIPAGQRWVLSGAQGTIIRPDLDYVTVTIVTAGQSAQDLTVTVGLGYG
jgi:hypothetical protein